MATTHGTAPSALTADELLHLFEARELSPVEVAREALERIEEINPQINALLAVDVEGSLAAAREAEQHWMRRQAGDAVRPLCGVPVTVKDTIEIAGMPTTYGSLAFRDNRAPDSAVGGALRAAGAIILGKANTSEFALSTFCINRLSQPTLNPHDRRRTAGGSSGGSAASVAAELAPLSIGTDSAGSIRIPAAFCGIFGLKPTFGTLPFLQRWRASPTRSHIGVLSRSVRDAEIAMAALTGNGIPPGAREGGAFLHGTRIFHPADDPDHGRALSGALRLLRDAGTSVQEVPPLPRSDVPSELDDGQWAFSGDHYCAAERLCPDFWEKHSRNLTSYAYPIYEAGRTAKAWQYRKVLDLAEAFRRRLIQWFEPFDLLITSACPEAPLQPASIEESGLGPRYANISIWNLSGHPAACVPFGVGEAGMPVALQIVGKHGEDARVLKLAQCIEALKPWRRVAGPAETPCKEKP